MRRHRWGRTGGVVAAALVGVTAVSGCGVSLDLTTAAPGTASQARLTAAGLTGATVDVDKDPVVAVKDGRLVSVAITGPDGPLTGTVSADATQWKATGELAFGTRYSVTAKAVDSRGVATTLVQQFTTLTPEHILKAEISPGDGDTFGVGMPLTVKFNRDVEDRAAVERRLKVTTATPVEGAWSWQDDQEVVYRPRTYWPANTKISVAVALKGVKAGDGLYGDGDRTAAFRTADSMVSVVNARTHMMTVRRNGQVVRTIPVTTGKPGFATRSGIKVIITRETSRLMDAATGGTSTSSSEYYRLTVRYAMRVTWTGEFLHAAPWSVGSQGRANVSHGCIGMSTGNASWLFENTHIGDVVQVTGTNRQQNLGNGITVWNVSWADWKAGSALTGTGQAPQPTTPVDDGPAASA